MLLHNGILSKPAEFVIKAAMIIIFVLINIKGIRDVGIVSTILSILVMVAFAMVAVSDPELGRQRRNS